MQFDYYFYTHNKFRNLILNLNGVNCTGMKESFPHCITSTVLMVLLEQRAYMPRHLQRAFPLLLLRRFRL